MSDAIEVRGSYGIRIMSDPKVGENEIVVRACAFEAEVDPELERLTNAKVESRAAQGIGDRSPIGRYARAVEDLRHIMETQRDAALEKAARELLFGPTPVVVRGDEPAPADGAGVARVVTYKGAPPSFAQIKKSERSPGFAPQSMWRFEEAAGNSSDPVGDITYREKHVYTLTPNGRIMEALDRFQRQQREDFIGCEYIRATAEQKQLASLEWSRRLREKVKASEAERKERERCQVTIDHGDD